MTIDDLRRRSMQRRRRRTRLGLTTLTVLALTALLGACGSGGGGSGVATLGGENAAGADGGGSGNGDEPTEAETQEAFRKFAQCMREHGVDMPDPQFGDDGGVMIGGAATAGSEELDPDQFEAADEECRTHIEGVIDARRENLDPEQAQQMQEQALAFAKCMREHGIDMPDPQFDADGGGRFSIALGTLGGGGIDPEDPAFQDAQEACSEEVGMEPPGGRSGPGRGGFSVGTKGSQ
jgi:hypothetical protein